MFEIYKIITILEELAVPAAGFDAVSEVGAPFWELLREKLVIERGFDRG